MDTKTSLAAVCAIALLAAAWISLTNKLERIERDNDELRQTLAGITNRWESEDEARYLTAQERLGHLRGQVQGWHDPTTRKFNVSMPLELFEAMAEGSR